MLVLICYVISQDHMIKGPCGVIVRSPCSAKFGGYRHVLVCHVISQGHLIKES